MSCITVLLLDFKYEHEKLEINNTDNVITLLPQHRSCKRSMRRDA